MAKSKKHQKKLDLQAVTLSQLSTIIGTHSKNTLYQAQARETLAQAAILIEEAAMAIADVKAPKS